MEQTKPSCIPIRFGIFELDLQAGELRRQGYKVKLQEQPFQVLAMLVERPGEVVTRDELQKRLWPADEFVDSQVLEMPAVGDVHEFRFVVGKAE